jgi:hypothetical protein
MKKLLLSALLIIGSFASFAGTVFNNTQCYIKIRELCYDPNDCQGPGNPPPPFTPTGVVITVGPMGTASIPTPSCTPPNRVAYEVCWDQPQCSVPCVIIDGQTPPDGNCGFPDNAALDVCVDCNPSGAVPTPVVFTPSGDITIN